MTTSFLNFILLVALLLFSNCENEEPIQHQYRINATLKIDGIIRTYLLVLPSTYYDDTTSFPLVIALHGTGGSASQFDRDYGLTQKANSSHFIIAYPEGVEREGAFKLRTWNAGWCCDYALENNVDDIGFIDELIDVTISSYKVKVKQVYLTGMSNGGMLAYRLACELPTKIAAIATVSCSMVVTQPCDPNRTIPILHIHSILDTKIPYEGGIGIGGYYYPPVDSVLKVWSGINQCSVTNEVLVDNSSYKLTRWSSCDSNAAIDFYLTKDGGHSWPGGLRPRPQADTPSTAINAADVIWEFLQQYRLP